MEPKIGIRDKMPGCAPSGAGSPYGCTRTPPTIIKDKPVPYTQQEVLRNPSGSGYGKTKQLFYSSQAKTIRRARVRANTGSPTDVTWDEFKVAKKREADAFNPSSDGPAAAPSERFEKPGPLDGTNGCDEADHPDPVVCRGDASPTPHRFRLAANDAKLLLLPLTQARARACLPCPCTGPRRVPAQAALPVRASRPRRPARLRGQVRPATGGGADRRPWRASPRGAAVWRP